MADIPLFLQQGWRYIWKQSNIFLFAAIISIGSWIFVALNSLHAESLSKSAPLLYLIIFGIVLFLSVYFYSAGWAGMIYTAYSAATKEPASFDTAWDVAKSSWRKMFLFWLALLAFVLPIVCIVLAFSIGSPPQPTRVYHNFNFVALPLATLAGITEFAAAGIAVRGYGIRESFRHALRIFFAHFKALASIGLIGAAAWYLTNLVSTAISMLIKSGLDLSSLRSIDYLFPIGSVSLGDYLPYRMLLAVGVIIYNAFFAAVFMAAYVKYGKGKRGRGEG